MYDFIDTNEQPTSGGLPAEAMSINGSYLENLVPGYRTLTVQGRELLGAEIESVKAGRQNGTTYRYKTYPERNITVQYQLIADTNEEFREAFNKLNVALNVEEAKIKFADESDKYFIGTPGEAREIKPGENNIVGEFTIVCNDPMKYGIEEHQIEPTKNGNKEYFGFNYDGSQKTFPELRVTFPKSDGRIAHQSDAACGYVSFKNQNGKELIFGNETETPVTDPVVELASEFSPSWTPGTNWQIRPSYDETSEIYKGPEPDFYFYKVTDWGNEPDSGNLSLFGQNSYSQKSSDFDFVSNVYFNSMREDRYELDGILTLALEGTSYTNLLEFRFEKEYGSQTGIFSVRSGYTDAWLWSTPFYFTDSILDTETMYEALRITVKAKKRGSTFTISVEGKQGLQFEKTFELPDLKNDGFNSIMVTYAKNRKVCPDLEYWGITNIEVTHPAGTEENTFGYDDSLKINTGDASVTLNNKNAIGLSAFSNPWEQFVLTPGWNRIDIDYSAWAQSKPSFELRYREAWL